MSDKTKGAAPSWNTVRRLASESTWLERRDQIEKTTAARVVARPENGTKSKSFPQNPPDCLHA